MTRLTWDNAAVMSEATAESIGVGQDELIELSAGEAKMHAPVFFLPGMAEGVIGIALGYGRLAAGHLGNEVGHDAYKLRTTADSGWRIVKARRSASPIGWPRCKTTTSSITTANGW